MHVRVSLPTSFPAGEVADLLVRPDVIAFWLGDEGVLSYAVGASVSFPRAVRDQGQLLYESARTAEVVSAGWHDGHFELVTRWNASEEGVRILVTPRPTGGSHVRIHEEGLESDELAYCALRVWQGALNRLHRLLRDAERQRNRARQAVVVVHGIGEQRPGQTLRSFFEAVFPRASGQARYVKPDYVSALFEMRTFTVPGDRAVSRPTTDVYELYWAHLIRDTTLAQVYAWLLRLLFSPRSRIPATLRRHVYFLRTILVGVGALVVALLVTDTLAGWSAAVAAGALAFAPGLLWAVSRIVGRTLLLSFVGDAARYLEPKPGNVARRQEIRQAGVDLLDALHDSGRYERIVLYGHSLGTVIAYDILTRTWAMRSRKRQANWDPQQRLSSRSLLALEDALNPRPGDAEPDLTTVRELQHAAWREHRSNGFSWLVTDFVTAGSPLAHARWLLNADKRVSFDDLVQERTFPTCPPVTEDLSTPTQGRFRHSFTFTHALPDASRPKSSRSVQVPNHAAPFALTRWTNLYFPLMGITRGDPVGGPMRDAFGAWVKDVPLEHPGGGILGFAHTHYVVPGGSDAHLRLLRESLELGFAQPLSALVPPRTRPARLA